VVFKCVPWICEQLRVAADTAGADMPARAAAAAAQTMQRRLRAHACGAKWDGRRGVCGDADTIAANVHEELATLKTVPPAAA
jgi:hypothetical protein